MVGDGIWNHALIGGITVSNLVLHLAIYAARIYTLDQSTVNHCTSNMSLDMSEFKQMEVVEDAEQNDISDACAVNGNFIIHKKGYMTNVTSHFNRHFKAKHLEYVL